MLIATRFNYMTKSLDYAVIQCGKCVVIAVKYKKEGEKNTMWYFVI